MAYLDGIYYQITGSGKPVVLIHGFPEDGTIWDKQTDYLKDKFQLIVPDLPGSGKSALTAGREGTSFWTMDFFAECIKNILDHEAITNPCMIGHSMGGYITLAFAERYASQLKAIGLFHSTAYADSEEKKQTRQKSIVFIEKHGTAKFLEQSTPNLFSEKFKKNNPEIVQELIARYTNFSPEALVNYYKAMMQRPDRTHILKTFPRPVLFIIGEHDSVIPLQQGLQQSYMPHIAHLLILKDSGHMGMLEEPDRCNAFLEKFLIQCEIANL